MSYIYLYHALLKAHKVQDTSRFSLKFFRPSPESCWSCNNKRNRWTLEWTWERKWTRINFHRLWCIYEMEFLFKKVANFIEIITSIRVTGKNVFSNCNHISTHTVMLLCNRERNCTARNKKKLLKNLNFQCVQQ